MRVPEVPELPAVYLHPGEIYICTVPAKISTVLGSCVAVTMFSPGLRIGAICHGALPACSSSKECKMVCIEAFKYVDCALRYMIESFRKLGVPCSQTIVKIFGGADTLMSVSSNTVGGQNVKSALEILGQHQFRVSAADVGDYFGRKLVFFSHTGEVYLKRFRSKGAPR